MEGSDAPPCNISLPDELLPRFLYGCRRGEFKLTPKERDMLARHLPPGVTLVPMNDANAKAKAKAKAKSKATAKAKARADGSQGRSETPVGEEVAPADGEGSSNMSAEEKTALQRKIDSLSDARHDRLLDFLRSGAIGSKGGTSSTSPTCDELDVDMLPWRKQRQLLEFVDALVSEDADARQKAAKSEPTPPPSPVFPVFDPAMEQPVWWSPRGSSAAVLDEEMTLLE